MSTGPKTKLRTDRIDDYFNYNLRNARINAGYTLAQVANKVGISLVTIDSYERLRALPHSNIAQKIADALYKDIDYLFPVQLKNIIEEIEKERKAKRKKNKFNDRFQYMAPLSRMWYKNLTFNNEISDEKDMESLKTTLDSELSILNERERKILELRYGLGMDKVHTYTEIASLFGLTRERIRQIAVKALDKLKQPARAKKLEMFLD